MRLFFLLLIAVALAAVYYFRAHSASATEPAAVVAVAQPTPTPVPFAWQAKVRTISEQLRILARSTSRGDTAPAMTKIGLAVENLKQRFERDGIRDEAAMVSAVRAAAAEAGFEPREIDAVAAAFQNVGASTPISAGRR